MTGLAARAVFLLAMLVPVVVGLWLYSFVFASPLGALMAPTPAAATRTPTPGANSTVSSSPAASPSPASASSQIATVEVSRPTVVVLTVTPLPVEATATSTQVALAPSEIATPSPVAPAPSATATPVPPTPTLWVPSATEPQSGRDLDPVETVQEFYRRVDQGDFDGAAQLWTLDMRRRYPPDANIRQRFASTRSIRVEQSSLANSNTASGQAAVYVQLVEVRGSPPVSQRLTGTWRLVRTQSGWLMDQPSFNSG